MRINGQRLLGQGFGPVQACWIRLNIPIVLAFHQGKTRQGRHEVRIEAQCLFKVLAHQRKVCGKVELANQGSPAKIRVVGLHVLGVSPMS